MEKKKSYQFPGEPLALALTKWLNGPGAEPFISWRKNLLENDGIGFSGAMDDDERARERVVGLLTDLKEAHRLDALLIAEDRAGWAAFNKVAEKINAVFSQYKSHNRFICNEPFWDKDRWVPTRHTDQPHRHYFWAAQPDLTKVPLQELWAAQVIRELDNEVDRKQRTLLDRIKTCAACGRWMYARKENQESHTEQCRREKYKDDRRRGRQHKKFLLEMKLRRGGKSK